MTALFFIGLATASSAIAAPATLSTTITGIDTGGPAEHLFGTLPDIAVDNNGRTFDISQTIRWKDGTAAPTDLLKTPQLLNSDAYRRDLSVNAWWDGYWPGALRINPGEGSLAVSMVPEPSKAGMPVAGPALGAVAIHRCRTPPRLKHQRKKNGPRAVFILLQRMTQA